MATRETLSAAGEPRTYLQNDDTVVLDRPQVLDRPILDDVDLDNPPGVAAENNDLVEWSRGEAEEGNWYDIVREHISPLVGPETTHVEDPALYPSSEAFTEDTFRKYLHISDLPNYREEAITVFDDKFRACAEEFGYDYVTPFLDQKSLQASWHIDAAYALHDKRDWHGTLRAMNDWFAGVNYNGPRDDGEDGTPGYHRAHALQIQDMIEDHESEVRNRVADPEEYGFNHIWRSDEKWSWEDILYHPSWDALVKEEIEGVAEYLLPPEEREAYTRAKMIGLPGHTAYHESDYSAPESLREIASQAYSYSESLLFEPQLFSEEAGEALSRIHRWCIDVHDEHDPERQLPELRELMYHFAYIAQAEAVGVPWQEEHYPESKTYLIDKNATGVRT